MVINMNLIPELATLFKPAFILISFIIAVFIIAYLSNLLIKKHPKGKILIYLGAVLAVILLLYPYFYLAYPNDTFSYLSKALISLPLIFFIPGYVFNKLLPKEVNLSTFSIVERFYFHIVISIIFTSLAGWLLAVIGYFSLINLILVLLLSIIPACIILTLTRKSVKLFFPSKRELFNKYVLISIIILVLSTIFVFNPTSFILGGWDHGVYPCAGIHIANTGKIIAYEPLITHLNTITTPGFYYTGGGTITPQFLYMYPIWIATFYSLFGLQSIFYVNPIFSVLAVFAIFIVVRRLLNLKIAFVASIILIITFTQVWVPRTTLAEPTTQFFIFAGILYFLMFESYHEKYFAVSSALLFSCSLLTRIDTLIVVALPLLIYLFLLIFSRFKKEYLYFYSTLFLGLFCTFIQYNISAPYTRDIFKGYGISGLYHPIYASYFFLSIFFLCIYIICDYNKVCKKNSEILNRSSFFRFIRDDLSRNIIRVYKRLSEWPTIVVFAITLVTLIWFCGYIPFINKFIGISYVPLVTNNLYLTPIGLTLGLFGIILMPKYFKNHEGYLFYLIGIISALFWFCSPHGTLSTPWQGRHSFTFLIPFFTIGIGLVLYKLWSKRTKGLIVIILLIILIISHFNVLLFMPVDKEHNYFTYSEGEGFLDGLQSIATFIGDGILLAEANPIPSYVKDDVYLVSGVRLPSELGRPAVTFAPSLYYVYGTNFFRISYNEELPSKIDALLKKESEIYFFHIDGYYGFTLHRLSSKFELVPVFNTTISYTSLARKLKSGEREDIGFSLNELPYAGKNIVHVTLYEIKDRIEKERENNVVHRPPIGFYPGVGKDDAGRQYRWTYGNVTMFFSTLTNRTSILRLSIVSPRPDYAPANVTIYINGIILTNFIADSGYNEYSFVIPKDMITSEISAITVESNTWRPADHVQQHEDIFDNQILKHMVPQIRKPSQDYRPLGVAVYNTTIIPLVNKNYDIDLTSIIQFHSMTTNSFYSFNITVKNRGIEKWNKNGENPVYVSYHWVKDGKVVLWDGIRNKLPCDVTSGNTIKMNMNIKAPREKGNYTLIVDLVKEGVTWFETQGAVPLKKNITVTRDGLKQISRLEYRTEYTEVNELKKLIESTFDSSATSFDGKCGRVYGFYAGSGYPQIWVRDSATIIPVARYLYSDEFLRTWIEEFLINQAENGSIYDYISPIGCDKNTVETDQETSLVHSAYQYYEISGNKSWLLKEIAGKTIIDRLDDSLRYVLKYRYNNTYDLVTGAYTADWGDVQFEDSPGTDVTNKTHWTCDIYDNAMFYRACRELSMMYSELGDKESAAFWSGIAQSIEENANKYLWQPDKGFYKMHVRLTPLNLDFTESDMFPMGGNAMAVRVGITNSTQASQIFKVAEERKKDANATTIGCVLYPPYPDGFFTNPIMDEEHEYQNGGQWDWFAGRLILAEFENGFSEDAVLHLKETSKQDISAGGLYVWYTLNGTGKGSSNYTGSAGVLGESIIKGYFGVYLSHDNLEIKPRLGDSNGSIYLYEPATDISISYNYSSFQNSTIILTYESNFQKNGKMSVLIPDGKTVSKILIDDTSVPYSIDRIGNDTYVSFIGDFKQHECEIILV